MTLTTPIRGSMSSRGKHLVYSTCTQNLASPTIPEVWLLVSKLKMCYVTLTTPILGWFVIQKLWLDIIIIIIIKNVLI